MRRSLAPLAAILALSAAPAGAREPLDFDLARLGPPSAGVWLAKLGCLTPAGDACTPQQQADAVVMAADARVRFARLATNLTLAFTSSLLEPASTTGHSGFQVGLESSYTGVARGAVGGSTGTFDPAAYGVGTDVWPSRSVRPSEVLMPSLHVRKALPFSFELGGRLTYLSQSSYFATQLEGKWAFVEGYTLAPDLAVRVAWTRLIGQRDLDLGATEFGLLASKRFGVSAVTSLTPYLALRLTRVSASSRLMAFGADYQPGSPPTPAPATPDEVALSSAGFPTFKSTLYRTTAGVRLTSFAVSMALELTYYGGGKLGGTTPGSPYGGSSAPSSLSGAYTFGFEF